MQEQTVEIPLSEFGVILRILLNDALRQRASSTPVYRVYAMLQQHGAELSPYHQKHMLRDIQQDRELISAYEKAPFFPSMGHYVDLVETKLEELIEGITNGKEAMLQGKD